MMKPKERKPEQPLSRQCHHFNKIFISGCIGSCQNDNFECSQCWKLFIKITIVCFSKPGCLWYGIYNHIQGTDILFIFILYQTTTSRDQQHYHILFITCFHWRLLSLQRSYWSKHTDKSKRKYCRFDEIFLIGCTERCLNNNFRCCQWLQIHWRFRFHTEVSPYTVCIFKIIQVSHSRLVFC